MAVMDNAIKNGYTFAWGSDVSEQGFTRDGIAVMPDAARGAELTGSDMARWTGLTAADKRKELTGKPLPEVNVTQEMRQTAFDNWETTDDHGMVIYGIAKDQNGKEYFMVKNSWGLSGKYKGIWYASKAFVAYKTMNILVHKEEANSSDYSIIFNTLQKDPSNSEKEAVLYIYRQLRNADPADDASAREVINNLFFSEKRYDLGEVGRYRINKKLGLTTDMDVKVLTKQILSRSSSI